jgi:putative spermidine/putrescine transport system ATP-binding protein
MSGGALRIERLRKRYGSLEALRIPELQVHEGELMAILGPSGSGKSTLLRTIAGFVHPDEGQIWLFGEEITWRPPSQRRMGVVFQQYSLFPHWSAEGNVRFALELRGLSRLEQARELNALFDLIGLQEARSRFPHQLSGGEQQRVALARALAVAPRVLLLDEPLSALDAVVRLQLREEIRRIQRATGVTTLFVTHDQHEALSLADRVAVMRAGRLEQLGTPQEKKNKKDKKTKMRIVGKQRK